MPLPLNKEQLLKKQERDIKRKEYLEYLEKKGKKVNKGNKKRNGSSGSSSSASCSSILDTGGLVNSSGSVWSVNAFITSAIYLKPTQIGFDTFNAICSYPVGDWNNGISETYQYITYYESRMVTSTVYDDASFDSAWVSGTTVGTVYGSDSNWTTSYSSSVGVGTYVHNTPVCANNYQYQMLTKVSFTNNINNIYGQSYKATWKNWSGQIYLSTLSAPSVSFNQTTNDFTISGASSSTARCVEFNRPSYTPYSSYLTSEETDICYNCAVRDHEWGIYYGQTQQAFDFTLWDIGSYSVKLTYASAHPSGTRTRFSNALNNWISIMNSAISGSGISFYRDDSDSNPDILVETKSNADMGAPSGYIYGGLWENSTNANGWIYHAYIRINYETSYYDDIWTNVEAIFTEELTEACGCGGDLTTRADCINTDFSWHGKSNGGFNTIDSHIQNFLYNSDIYICVGTDSEDLAVQMNPSNGFTWTNTTTTDAYWMLPSISYNLRVWQANSSNYYSVVPSYSQTFTPINYPTMTSAPVLSSRTQTRLDFTWTGTNADWYTLAYSLDNSTWKYIEYISNPTYYLSSVSIGSDFKAGQTYYVKVKAGSNYNKPSSAYSNTSLATSLPSVPTGLTVNPQVNHTCDVAYTKGISNSGYTVTTDIDWTNNTGNWGSIEFSAQSGSSYNIDVGSYTLPYFRVRSQITVSGTTLYSDWSSTVALNLTYPELFNYVPVSQPSNSLSVDVSWSSNIYATSYEVSWGTDQVNWTIIEVFGTSTNVGVGSEGNKYFRARSKRNVNGWITYSVWRLATPYPINVVLNPRPTNFTWVNTPVSGNAINLKASDVNNLRSKINEFRVYKGLSNYDFAYNAIVGNIIYASEFNEIRTALNALSAYFTGGNTVVSARSSGNNIAAADWLSLSNSLNSIA
jgi:hypothetical protein